jgi:hypothetical protein
VRACGAQRALGQHHQQQSRLRSTYLDLARVLGRQHVDARLSGTGVAGCGSVPQVRKYTAEQLYVRLLTLGGDDDDGDVDEQTEAAMEVLSGTRWDADVGVVKAARTRLYAPLKLTPPVLKAKREAGDGGARAAGVAADEHASYASLVDTAGY